MDERSRVARMLASLVERLRAGRRPRVASLGALAHHVSDHAAFVSQKATWDYVRARAGISWEKLFSLPDFRDALEYCRWEAYAATLTDVAEVTHVLLRRAGAPEPPLPELLVDIVRVGLVKYPLPDYRRNWEDVIAPLQARFERANLAPPRPVHTLGGHAAERVYEVMPIHDSLKKADKDFITNNIRFLLVRFYEDSERLLDLPALVAAIREGTQLSLPATPAAREENTDADQDT